MPVMEKGPRGGSFYVSKGKKVYADKAPAKPKAPKKPQGDPLGGLDPALVARLRASPAAQKALGLKPTSKAPAPAKKAAPKKKAKAKAKPKKPGLSDDDVQTLAALRKAKSKPKKSKPKTKAEPEKAKPKEASASKTKDKSSYIDGDTASPAAIKKMEKIEHASYNKFSKSEKASLKEYTGDGYESINKKLRAGGKPTGDAVEMDKAFASASLSHDMQVYRGFTLDGRTPPKIGSKMQDNAYVSTSHGQRRAEGFLSRKDESVLVKIKVPKGSKAIYIGKNSKYGNEQELLLDRGAQMKFTSRKKVGNVWHYEAELVSTNQSRI